MVASHGRSRCAHSGSPADDSTFGTATKPRSIGWTIHLDRGGIKRILMGLFLRKSIKFGPFRINLSKSGIGVSGGIKGARISAGPKGTQLNLGRKGLYYRQQLSTRTPAGGGWLARIIAYFSSHKQVTPIELPEPAPREGITEFISPRSTEHHGAPLVNSPLQRKRILTPKPHVSYEN